MQDLAVLPQPRDRAAINPPELGECPCVLLEADPTLVGPGDLPLLERLVRDSKTWAYVDGLAGDVLGELLIRHPRTAPKLDRWAKDPDFWVRRSALLAQIKPLKNGAPFTRFAR